MIERQLRQSSMLQARGRDRLVSGAVIGGVHALLVVALLLSLRPVITPRLVLSPFMVSLLAARPEARPVPLPSLHKPLVQAPRVDAPAIEVAEPQTASPVLALAASPDTSLITASLAPGRGSGTSQGGAGAESTVGGGGGGLDLSDYLARVARHIESFRHPIRFRMRGGPHVVQVYLHFRKDGSILSARLAHGSGILVLDNEALAQVLRSQPLPPIPPEFGLSEIEGVIPVLFR
jgi:TonB family protein